MEVENLKLLVITEVFFPEEFLINDLVFTWKNEGRDVSVLTRNPSYPFGKIYPNYKNRFFQKEEIKGVPVFRIQFIPKYNSNKFFKILNYLWNMFLGMLWALKNGKKYDAIYIYQTGPLTFSAIGVLIKILFKKKITIWTQDVWPDTVFAYGIARKGVFKIIIEKFVKWVYCNCDNITVTSPGFIEIIKKYAPSKNIQFIPQWSLTSKLKNSNNITNDIIFPGSFNFVFAGNIGKAQNLERLIEGFEIFYTNSANKEVWLNLIGDGSQLEFLKEKVYSQKIKNIKFWGRVNSSEMPLYYEKSDILIISLEDSSIFNMTIPAKFQSYLNAEKPIFGVLNGEVANLICDNNIGWVTSPNDINKIAEKLQEISICELISVIEKAGNTARLLNNNFNREKIIVEITSLIY